MGEVGKSEERRGIREKRREKREETRRSRRRFKNHTIDYRAKKDGFLPPGPRRGLAGMASWDEIVRCREAGKPVLQWKLGGGFIVVWRWQQVIPVAIVVTARWLQWRHARGSVERCNGRICATVYHGRGRDVPGPAVEVILISVFMYLCIYIRCTALYI